MTDKPDLLNSSTFTFSLHCLKTIPAAPEHMLMFVVVAHKWDFGKFFNTYVHKHIRGLTAK